MLDLFVASIHLAICAVLFGIFPPYSLFLRGVFPTRKKSDDGVRSVYDITKTAMGIRLCRVC